MKTAPTKTEYLVGEAFDTTGMVCTVYVGDNIAIDITGGWTISPTVMGSTETLMTITYNGVSTTQKMMLPTYLPTFGDNSWSTIAAAAKANVASTLWNIGDKKTFTTSSGVSCTAMIVDFDNAGLTLTSRSSDYGTNKSTPSISLMIVPPYGKAVMDATDDDDAGMTLSYSKTAMRNTTMPNLLATFPEDLQLAIKEVWVESYGDGTLNETSKEKLFIPSSDELADESNPNNGYIFGYIEAGNSWPFSSTTWTRTCSPMNNYPMCFAVYESGSISSFDWSYNSNYITPVFNI